MTAETLLTLIEALGQPASIEVSSVERLVGGTFVETSVPPDLVDRVATDAPGLSRVWLQQARGSASIARLSLTVAPGVCATWDQARARFGFAAKVPVHPGSPQPPEDWWQFPGVETARLSLGFDRQTGCLGAVTLQPLAVPSTR